MMTREELMNEVNEITLDTIEKITEDKNDPHTSYELDKWGAQQFLNKYGTKISELLCFESSNDDSIKFNKELCRMLRGCRKMTHENLIKKVKELWHFAELIV